MNRHAPERTVVVRDKRTPWITRTIKEAVAERDLAYALYSRNPNRIRGDDRWLEYERKRDRANSLIFAAKKRFAEQHFDHNLPAKKLWSNLRREGIHNNAKKNEPAEDFDANELNAFFATGHRQLQVVDRSSNSSEPSHRTAVDPGDNGFVFRHTDVNEIARRIFEVQTNATGTDDIPISFIKLLSSYLCSPIFSTTSGKRQSSHRSRSAQAHHSRRTFDRLVSCLQRQKFLKKFFLAKLPST